jgi:uncharacterized protein (TIGR02246 family)
MTPSPGDAELHAVIAERVRAVRAKDVEGLLSGYAPEVATFDLVVPLASQGIEAVRKRVTEWFASFQTPIEYEIRDVTLQRSGDLAFEHHFTHVQGTNRHGDTIDMWFRETVGYRRLDGRWRVTHQHSSVPLDMVSGKGALGLKP